MGLDTRLWNLSVGVAVAAGVGGCGPTVLLPQDDDGIADTGDTGDTGRDDVDSGTIPNDEEGPPPDQCQSDADCQGGYGYCVDGTCEYYGYNCDDGCCDGACYYGDCYSDQDCGTGSLCDNEDWYGYCYEVLLPECDQVLPTEQLVIPLDPGDEIVSLSFVDRDGGGSDLVVGLEGRAKVVHSVEEQVELDLTDAGEVITATSGDLDGDGDRELVLSTTMGGLLVYEPDGMGSYVQSAIELSPIVADDLAVGPFAGDEANDVLFQSGTSTGYLTGLGGGTFDVPASFADAPRGIARLYTGPSGMDGLVVGIDGNASIDVSSSPIDTSEPVSLPLSQRMKEGHALVRGRFGDPLETGFVTYRTYDDWTLLDIDSGDFASIGLLGSLVDALAGDIDGDGDDDLLGRTSDGVQVARSGPPAQFDCQQTLEVTIAASSQWAVGDFDGDGDADIAAGNGATLVVYAPQ